MQYEPKELVIKTKKHKIHTGIFLLLEQKIMMIPIMKLRLIFKYKFKLNMPNIIINHDVKSSGIICKINMLFYSCGWFYPTKNKPKINPILYEIILKIMINVFLFLKIIDYIK